MAIVCSAMKVPLVAYNRIVCYMVRMSALIRQFKLLDVVRVSLLVAVSIATVTYCSGSFALFPSVLACIAIIASLVYFKKLGCRDFAFPSLVGRVCCLMSSLAFSFVLVLGAHIRVAEPVIAGGVNENYIEPYSVYDIVAFCMMAALVFWILSALVQLSGCGRRCAFVKKFQRANGGDTLVPVSVSSVVIRALVIFLLYLPFFMRYFPGLFFWRHLFFVRSDYGVESPEQPSSGCFHFDDGRLHQDCRVVWARPFGGRCIADGISDGLRCLHVWLSCSLGDFPLGGFCSLVLAARGSIWLVSVLRTIFSGALEGPTVFLLPCFGGGHAYGCRFGAWASIGYAASACIWPAFVRRHAAA